MPSVLTLTCLVTTLLAPAGPADEAAARARLEETIESLQGPLSELSRSVLNLALPDSRARPLFGDHVQVVDLGGPRAGSLPLPASGARAAVWETGEAALKGGASVALWEELLSEVDYFLAAEFSTLRGEFDPDDPGSFRADTTFRGRARLRSGGLVWVRASLGISWRGRPEGPGTADARGPGWRIHSFRTEHLTVERTSEPLFEDVLERVLSESNYVRATRSPSDEMLVFGGECPPVEGQLGSRAEGSYGASSSHPCVVDVDRDGWDDVFLLRGGSPPMMLRNRGDGTFTDVASELGLALEGLATALFGDFDNDGDPDAFLSFLVGSTRYAENDRGRFVLSPDAGEFPAAVLGFSAVDLDADGLLDVSLDVSPDVFMGGRSGDQDARPTAESRLFRNAGHGRFQHVRDGEPVEAAGFGRGAAFLDVQNDGWPDLNASAGAFRSGSEESSLFRPLSGRTPFRDLTGLDDPGESRALAALDFDRDGYVDMALGGVSTPRFRLLRNRSAERVEERVASFVALRLVGGNDRPEPSREWSARDALGSRIRIELAGGRTLHREHGCGDGFGGQGSTTLLVGVGQGALVQRLEVVWPSGRMQEVSNLSAGTLLTCYENPGSSPDGKSTETRVPYTAASRAGREAPTRSRSRLHLGEGRHGKQGLTLYTTVSTTCLRCTRALADVRPLRRSFDADELTLLGVPVAARDSAEDLADYERVYAPAYRLLVDLSEEEIQRVRSVVSRVLRTPAESTPATIVTDAEGRILGTSWGVPTISELRRLRARGPLE